MRKKNIPPPTTPTSARRKKKHARLTEETILAAPDSEEIPTETAVVFLQFLAKRVAHLLVSICWIVLSSVQRIGDGFRILISLIYRTSVRPIIGNVRVKYFVSGAVLVGVVSIGFQLRSIIDDLPNPKYLTRRDLAVTTKLYDRNDQLLYEFYREQNRTPLALRDIPKHVIDATIATEDKEFYLHKGFSLSGVTRAVIHNIRSENQEGGSTITQQLIRSAYLSPEKTVVRKLKEIALSVWAERYYTKDQILEMYLNQVPYGGTAWGIEAAAQTYFGKSAKDVTLSEAAYLAGLPAAPSAYSPYTAEAHLARDRQHYVLSRMVANGFISQTQADDAAKEPVNIRPATTAIAAPHFVMYVRELLNQAYGQTFVATAGLRIKTTLDLKLQTSLQNIVVDRVESLQYLSVGNGALLVTDPKSGEILAMVGSHDYFDTQYDGNVNVTTAHRQPGSSIKVVTYAAALQQGFTAASLLEDTPVSYTVEGQPPYRPVNYDGKFHGYVPLRVALGSSYNIPAVRVLNKIGIQSMIDQGRRMGITSWTDPSKYGVSLTLGGGEVTMLEMATVYGTLANQGKRHDLTPFLSISDYRGETIPNPYATGEIQAVPAGVAFILSHILSDNAARTPAFGSNSTLVLRGKTAAVKTGTSDNKRDNWTIGYTPNVVVTVWVGNNDNSPMHPQLTSGITGAAPIWHDVMEELLKKTDDTPFPQPDDIVAMPCYGRTEYFLIGTQPKGGCPTPPQASPTQQQNQ